MVIMSFFCFFLFCFKCRLLFKFSRLKFSTPSTPVYSVHVSQVFTCFTSLWLLVYNIKLVYPKSFDSGVLKGNGYIFPFRENHFSERRQNNFKRIISPERVSSPIKTLKDS